MTTCCASESPWFVNWYVNVVAFAGAVFANSELAVEVID